MIEQKKGGRGMFRLLLDNGLRIGASLVMVLGISVVYQYATLSSAGLYRQMYTPYAASASGDSTGSGELLGAYRENDNRAALAIFNRLPHPAAADYLLAGNALLKLDSSQAAIRIFQALLESDRHAGSHRYEDEAEYYLALSWLSAGKIRASLPLFQKIHNDRGHAHHDAVSVWFLRRLRWLESKK